MILVVTLWIFLFFLFLSYGYVGARIIGYSVKEKINFGTIELIFLGIGVLGVITISLSLFLPLNIYIWGCITGFGGLILVLNRKTIFPSLKIEISDFLFNLSFYRLILFALIFIGILIYSLSSPFSYDMDLYHLQNLRWLTEYKAILGLGNLHGRFAFNSSFLLLSSLFYNFKTLLYIFPINSFVAVLLLLWIFQKWTSMKIIPILIVAIIMNQLGGSMSSTSTDFCVNILILFLLLYAYQIEKYSNSLILYITALSLFCITLKLSSIIIIFLPLFLFIRSIKLGDRISVKKVILCGSILGILFLFPWLVRNIILSGYLIYPFDKIDLFSVDWKIPQEFVVAEKEAAYAWARIPEVSSKIVLGMSYSEWVPVWFRDLHLLKQSLFFSAFLSPIPILILRYFKKLSPALFIIWFISFIGSLYLFFTAPDIRFSISFILVAGFIPYLEVIRSKSILGNLAGIGVLLSAIFIGSYNLKIGYGQLELFQLYTQKSLSRILIHPQEYGLKTEIITYQTFQVSGADIYFNIKNDRCYDHHLPCTIGINPNLHFRGEKMEDGFIINQK